MHDKYFQTILTSLMSRFSDLFSHSDVPAEAPVAEPVVEPVVEKIEVVEEKPQEVLPPKPLQQLAKPKLRRSH